MNLIDQDQAIQAILHNQIVALPTETVYGLFGLGNSQKSVNTVYEIKNRPTDNPLICHFYNFEQILQNTINHPEYLELLIKSFCPGPITFLLELNPNSDLKPTVAGQTKLCCRIPENQTTLEIIKQVGVPLFGPSANSSSRVSGTNPKIIFEDLGDRIAGIVDGGKCQIGLESTIIDCTNPNEIRILRPGAIGKKEIEEVFSKYNFQFEPSRHPQLDQESSTITTKGKNIMITENQISTSTTPGAKYRHYSPKTKVVSRENLQQLEPKSYILGFQEDLDKVSNNFQKIPLGSIQNPQQIAHSLFQNLFSIDELHQEQIYFYNGEFAKQLFTSKDSIQQAISNRLNKVLL